MTRKEKAIKQAISIISFQGLVEFSGKIYINFSLVSSSAKCITLK